MKSIKLTIRLKLILSVIIAVLITGGSTVITGLYFISDTTIGQAYEKIRSDKRTAKYIYTDSINIIHLFVKHLASLPYLKEAIVTNNRSLLYNKLKEVKDELNLDILNITDAEGRVIVRARNPYMYGDSVREDLLIRQVLRDFSSCSGSDIMARDYLAREGKDLAEQAYIRLIPTPKAKKVDRDFEDRGLVLKAAAPFIHEGRLIGIIYGATLMNRNFEIVDRIKNLVFKDEKIKGFDYGTATIFLDDLRVSTNVKTQEGERAIGTRVSAEVYERVVNQGMIWFVRAFVVNNWYISAYTPIYNIENKVIGILYVGILEEKFNQIREKITVFFLVIIIVTLNFAILIVIYLIQNILNPIKSLVLASNEIAKGNYNTKISIKSKDEFGYLCRTFNSMVDAIVERDNLAKEQAEKQIIQTEKMASLGRLASGIAHEINNPLTGVLTYSSILLEEIKDPQHREDLQVIVNETLRCRKIVKEILDFARETRLEKQSVNINNIIADTLSILEKHVSFQNVRIIKDLSERIPEINIDINLMKSVINNLAMNAADAMQDMGELLIKTSYDPETDIISMQFTDTGYGISEENIGKIFDPFFTTKDTGKGTGLGLAVTYGIIKRHNGSIEVNSKVGEGTTFTIKLPGS